MKYAYQGEEWAVLGCGASPATIPVIDASASSVSSPLVGSTPTVSNGGGRPSSSVNGNSPVASNGGGSVHTPSPASSTFSTPGSSGSASDSVQHSLVPFTQTQQSLGQNPTVSAPSPTTKSKNGGKSNSGISRHQAGQGWSRCLLLGTAFALILI